MATVFCDEAFWGSIEADLNGPEAGLIRAYLSESDCNAFLSAFTFSPYRNAHNAAFAVEE